MLLFRLTPPTEGVLQFPGTLPEREWRLWLSEVAQGVDFGWSGSGQHSLGPTALEQAGALGPFDQRPQPAIALPVQSIWTIRVECWLTPSATVHLRRLDDGSYAALVVARQEGKSLVVACAATVDGTRIVFDRTVPWGPCREARVCVAGGVMTLAPLGQEQVRSVPGQIDICSAWLAMTPEPAVEVRPTSLAEKRTVTSKEQELQSAWSWFAERFTIRPRKPRPNWRKGDALLTSDGSS